MVRTLRGGTMELALGIFLLEEDDDLAEQGVLLPCGL